MLFLLAAASARDAAGRRKLCLLSAQRYSQQLNARRLRVSGPEMLQTQLSPPGHSVLAVLFAF